MTRVPKRQDRLDALAGRYLTDAGRRTYAGSGSNGRAPGLSDEEVLALCRGAKNSGKFVTLFDVGDTAAYGDDHSRADQALVGLLALRTHDPAQLDRLFRRSALYRPDKWGARADYRERTMTRALSNLSETYSSSSPSPPRRRRDGDDGRPPLAVKSFKDLPRPNGPRRFFVKGLVPERFATTIYGGGGSAKSVIALSMALGAARGDTRWLGHEMRPCPALYVDWELDEEEQGRRARQLARAAGDGEPPESLYYLCAAGLRRSEVMAAAHAACEEHQLGLVILDSVGLAMEGDPGDARATIDFFQDLDQFRSRGVTLLLVDHQSKGAAGDSYQGKTAYGSVYKGNLSRSRFQVEVKNREPGTLGVVLRHNKANFSGLSEPFRVRISFGEELIAMEREELAEEELAEEGTLNASDRVLLVLQSGPAFPEELVAPTGVVLGTVKNTLTGLKRRRLVEATGEQRGKAQEVRLSAEGRRHVRDYLGGRSASSPSEDAPSGPVFAPESDAAQQNLGAAS